MQHGVVRGGTTQVLQVVPKVAAGNTVAVLHKCPSRSRSPNPSLAAAGYSYLKLPASLLLLLPGPVIIRVSLLCCVLGLLV